MKSIYVTFDNITQETGAGKVCYHEIEALKRVTDLEKVISRKDIEERIGKYYPFNPFTYDYFAADLAEPADIAHLSCSPGMALLNKIKPKKSLVNIVAHDLNKSIEEHERITGTPYPFPHNTDPYLHEALLKHAEKADVVITPSEGSSRWIKENIKARRIEVIPHGCDLTEKVAPLPEEFKAGYLGVWGPDKGLIYLLLAWNHLDYKDTEFIFAGDCGEPLKAIIPSLLDTGAKYRLLGRIPDTTPFFNSLSAYVQVSVSEGFGMPVLEAMAHGRAVVVTEGTGASYLVEDGKEGFVIPIRDPKAIAEAIDYLKNHPKEVKKMGDRARKKAEKYSWDEIEKKYVRLYQSLSKSSGGNSSKKNSTPSVYDYFLKYYLSTYVDADVEYFARYFDEPLNSKIIEVGANQEPISNILSLIGYDVVGVDLRDYEEEKRDFLPLNFRFVKGDFMELMFDEEFDVVISTSAVEHFGLGAYGEVPYPEKNGDILAMKKIWDILREGGHVYLTVPVGVHEIDVQGWRIYDKKELNERIIQKFTVLKRVFFTSGIVEGYTIGEKLDVEYAFTHKGPETTVLLILEKRT